MISIQPASNDFIWGSPTGEADSNRDEVVSIDSLSAGECYQAVPSLDHTKGGGSFLSAISSAFLLFNLNSTPPASPKLPTRPHIPTSPNKEHSRPLRPLRSQDPENMCHYTYTLYTCCSEPKEHDGVCLHDVVYCDNCPVSADAFLYDDGFFHCPDATGDCLGGSDYMCAECSFAYDIEDDGDER